MRDNFEKFANLRKLYIDVGNSNCIACENETDMNNYKNETECECLCAGCSAACRELHDVWEKIPLLTTLEKIHTYHKEIFEDEQDLSSLVNLKSVNFPVTESTLKASKLPFFYSFEEAKEYLITTDHIDKVKFIENIVEYDTWKNVVEGYAQKMLSEEKNGDYTFERIGMPKTEDTTRYWGY